MPSGAIHYEIYTKPPRSKWLFHGAEESRDTAIELAKELARNGTSVQVTKETLGSKGNYLSVCIFRDGHSEFTRQDLGKLEIFESLICLEPADLYTYGAVDIIARLLKDNLSDWKITPIELLHSSKNLERLDKAGTILQGAIQKIAISQSQIGEGTVADRLKFLHKLVSDAMIKVHRDYKNEKFPTLKNIDLPKLVQSIGNNPQKEYILFTAITEHLADSPDWNTKLERILSLPKKVSSDADEQTFYKNSIDRFVAGILSSPSALKDMIVHQADRGGFLLRMTELICGKLSPDMIMAPAISILNEEFAKGALPRARISIVQRILNELEGPRRLANSSTDEEVKYLRKLGSQLTIGCRNLVPTVRIVSAFRARSAQLVSGEFLEAHLKNVPNRGDRALKTLLLMENIIGDVNKQKLMSFLREMITSPQFRDSFFANNDPIAKRLRLLTSIQEKISNSEPETQNKQLLTNHLDKICVDLIEQHKIIVHACEGQDNSIDKCVTLLKLINWGFFTHGNARKNAYNVAAGYLQEPGALQNYLQNFQNDVRAEKIKALTSDLKDSGLSSDLLRDKLAYLTYMG